jgi:superfamily II DNA helicase RecQ
MPQVSKQSQEAKKPEEVYKNVRKYKEDDIDLAHLSSRAQAILQQKSFHWRLEIAAAILCGKDVIVDVGTGSGKTLCFELPILLDKTEISVLISPLTSLMIDQGNPLPPRCLLCSEFSQAKTAKISTVAICSETIEVHGADKIYEVRHWPSRLNSPIITGHNGWKFHQVIVSPEIARSAASRKAVISKAKFHNPVRAVCIDEAHCISLWGGSFRPDYSDLGVLCGRFPSHIPFVIASATLPEHVLDGIRRKIQLSKDAVYVSVSNARPNVALSFHAMSHSEEWKGDLRFLIPPGAKKIEDLPVTLVY